MTIVPSPYDLLRSAQDQLAVMTASLRAMERSVAMLAGMLDKSAPDPIPDWTPARPAVEPPPRKVVPASWQPREKPRANRPMRRVEIGGVPVLLSEARAGMVDALREKPCTTEEIVALGLSKSMDAVRKSFGCMNAEFEKLGIRHRIKPIERLSRVGPKGGAILPRYALVDPAKETAPLDIQPAAQSEAAAGASPDSEAPVRAAGGGAVDMPAQGASFAMPTGAGEGVSPPADPAPAADAQPISRSDDALPIVPASPLAALTRPLAGPSEGKPIPAATALVGPPIAPGNIVAVDVARCLVTGPKGTYQAPGAHLARALDHMKGGHLFGLDVIAKKAGWPSPDVAKTGLQLAAHKLRAHGIDVFVDKYNARLREAS